MPTSYFQSMRTALLAAAMAAGLAQAQPETPMPPPPDQPAKARPAPHASRPAAQRCDGSNGESLHAGRLATHVGQPQDFERSVERTRQPAAGGSVSGGGVLREYTETVPARP